MLKALSGSGRKHKNGKKMMRLMQKKKITPLTDTEASIQRMGSMPAKHGFAQLKNMVINKKPFCGKIFQ